MSHVCAKLTQISREFPTALLTANFRRISAMDGCSIGETNSPRKFSRARNPKKQNSRSRAAGAMWSAADEASNTLTRRPATYNRILDLRTRQPADALIRVDVKILEHRLNANISRSSCPYLRAIYRRHHPLTKSLWKKRGRNGATKSDKRRQRTCRNMTPFVAGNLPLVVAFCRPQ
jgi:hypothetical protein